jgi:hypothetical protein
MSEATLFPQWKQVVRDLVADGLKPGDALAIDDLAIKFGLKVPETAAEQKKWAIDWLEAFTPFREFLLTKHNVCLKPGYDGTYVVIPPAEQVEHAESYHIKRVHKELRQAAQKMRHVDRDALTVDEQHKQVAALGRIAFIKNAVRGRDKVQLLPLADNPRFKTRKRVAQLPQK